MQEDLLKKLKEPLKIEEVDFRLQSINNGGYATILAYKDARVDMNRLDAVFGSNWQKDYKTIDGNLYCGVAIKVGDEWLWRWDVGTESFSDKEKGQASDAFKRACFNWGIGRELYNYPPISVKLESDEYSSENGKCKQTWKLNLKKWKWSASFGNDGNIKTLSAFDENGKIRFSYPNQENNQQSNHPAGEKKKEAGEAEKPWLNVMENESNFTKQWKNIIDAIDQKKINNVAQVREHYKVSKEVENKINALLNNQKK